MRSDDRKCLCGLPEDQCDVGNPDHRGKTDQQIEEEESRDR